MNLPIWKEYHVNLLKTTKLHIHYSQMTWKSSIYFARNYLFCLTPYLVSLVHHYSCRMSSNCILLPRLRQTWQHSCFKNCMFPQKSVAKCKLQVGIISYKLLAFLKEFLENSKVICIPNPKSISWLWYFNISLYL